ncbi:MAG TPA: putative baseplate assembly protein [Verrucomicrobiales bacterium]|nr:putative baseplate assembly protein [Verrucomicrobiales bacterium]
MLKYFCCQERRRNAVREHPVLNGIDYLEVYDPGEPDPSTDAVLQELQTEYRQRRLFVRFLKPDLPGQLTATNVVIEGGERIRDIHITRVEVVDAAALPFPELGPVSPPGENVLLVDVAEPGDFSTYTLRLIQDEEDLGPPSGFDPILSAVDFSFKVGCPSDFDCEARTVCPPEPRTEPEINYLAKDYASFRQLMLDRLSVTSPAWRDRLPADLGIALVEMLAYVGDYLSYQQDAVATEAYLRTARLRSSVRRHARLVDYFMHDGCNARVWVHLQVRDDIDALPLSVDGGGARMKFLTRSVDAAAPDQPVFDLAGKTYESALDSRVEVFEPLHGFTLRAAHNKMSFHTWAQDECCLPRGAVRATLRGSFPALQAGDVLIFEELKGPRTGHPEDADPRHRHSVRLIDSRVSEDPLGDETVSPLQGIPVTEIEWHPDDALPFPLCISSRGVEEVSVALGNIVFADHGLTVEGEDLPPVPEVNPALAKVLLTPGAHCGEEEIEAAPPRYRPRLQQTARARPVENRPLTFAAPFDPENPPPSAAGAFRHSAGEALPQIKLTKAGQPVVWEPVRDLLSTGAEAPEFVVETENDGSAFLRFGDDRFGSRPAAGTQLTAHYRVGNGSAGNVGAGSIAHVASADSAIISELDNPVLVRVYNPLPAAGGTDPESLETVRQNAPAAFRTQERAVTLEDYGAMAHRCDSRLQSAAATSRWTGSWHTIFLTVDRLAGQAVDETYEEELRECLERYRMAGHDLEVDLPRPAPLELHMSVCVHPDYFRSDVRNALLERFSNRLLSDGSKGVFHPDYFALGQTVFLSPFYEGAQSIPGVASVTITTFQRQDDPSNEALDSGSLELGPLEIARLDNDPNFPERGKFVLSVEGGK